MRKIAAVRLSNGSAAPNSATGYYLLAEATTRRGQGATALDALRKAHNLERSGASLSRLMQAMASQGQVRSAHDLANAWIQKYPQDIVVRGALAESLVRQRDFSAARKQYSAVLGIAPNDLNTINNLANTLIELKDAQAVEIAERGLKLAPGNVTLLDTAGWAQHHLGSGERALLLLREARLRAPSNLDVKYHLAAALAKAGRQAEARAELTTALQSGVNFASADEAKKLLGTLN